MNEPKSEICVDFDDGAYCKQCNSFHPTLMWHNKYSEYLDKNNGIERIINAFKRIDETISYNEACEIYQENLDILKLEISEIKGNCIVCSTETKFKNTRTNNYVCSDECKYVDNKKK